MKPILEKISKSADHSFFVGVYHEKYFPSPLHFHPEIEIILIVQGYGTRVIGDSIDNYYPGDLVIIGPNVPHVFASSPDFYQEDTELYSKAIVIQFEKYFWGSQFMKLPESHKLSTFLDHSLRGIRFNGKTRNVIEKKILDFPEYPGLRRVNSLLEILEIMSSDPEIEFLSSPSYLDIRTSSEDIGRMEKLYNFIFQNFARQIRIEEAAALIHLSPHSFCRYFKSRTNRSFSNFLNEVRIGNACKLMIEDNMNIAQIAYQSGFNHLSHFNRQFRQIKGMTPSGFRDKYLHPVLP